MSTVPATTGLLLCRQCGKTADVVVTDVAEIDPTGPTNNIRAWKIKEKIAFCLDHNRPGRSYMQNGEIREYKISGGWRTIAEDGTVLEDHGVLEPTG